MAKKQVMAKIDGRTFVGQGSTMRAAVKDLAERASNALSTVKKGDGFQIVRLEDSAL